MSRAGLDIHESGFGDDNTGIVVPPDAAAVSIARPVNPIDNTLFGAIPEEFLPAAVVNTHLRQFYDPFLDYIEPALEQSKEALAALRMMSGLASSVIFGKTLIGCVISKRKTDIRFCLSCNIWWLLKTCLCFLSI